MSQPWELSIILNPPPEASPRMLASFTIRCDALGLNYKGNVLPDLLTDEERNNLHWYLEEYWKWPYEQFAARGKYTESLLPDIGMRLYEAVFGSIKTEQAFQAWQTDKNSLRQISIVSDIPQALNLPWELLHDEQGFLVFHAPYPISVVRRLSQSVQPILPMPFEPPLRVLLVSPRPVNTGFVDPRGIARELLYEMQDHIKTGAVEIELLQPPTFSRLRTRLEDHTRPIHILHFDGHGVFDKKQGKQGLLAFENDGERMNLVKASDLRKVLHQSGMRLVVFTACQSAVSATDDASSNVATQLLQSESGVDAVIAMSASILTTSAVLYARTLYRGLATGMSVQFAHEQARRTLHDDPRRHPFYRRRDEEGELVNLLDWWLPHFYQQHPVHWQPLEDKRLSEKSLQIFPVHRFNKEMPAQPRYGFSGRSHELLRIERALRRRKLVIVHGFGGVGKTALVREVADWLTQIKLYDGACFVSFEHGGDAITVLYTIGYFLNVYGSKSILKDHLSMLAVLGPLLKNRRILVIVDSFESILTDGVSPLDAATLTQLWDVLLELAALGAGILLTSCNIALDDARLSPGRQITYLRLGELNAEDAYAFAIHLLADLSVDHKLLSYKDLRHLLEQLGYHPLSIELVLPALRKMPLSTIVMNFATLLPTFADDTIMGRNRSLVASLEYSLQRLSEEHTQFLPRLAPFEGGAMENLLLGTTEIPTSDWERLLHKLEEAALVTTEQIHKELKYPFIRFHPLLAPFLRSKYGTGNVTLCENYISHYLGLAILLHDDDGLYPEPFRALTWRELPNLQHVLRLLLKAGDLVRATLLMGTLDDHLMRLGLISELGSMRQQVAQAKLAVNSDLDKDLDIKFLQETGFADTEARKGEWQASISRYTRLLTLIEDQSEGQITRNSYEHFLILGNLAVCLLVNGQGAAAEHRMREALAILLALIECDDSEYLVHELNTLLTNLGSALMAQKKYPEAREVFQDALELANERMDLISQASVLSELGVLALNEGEDIQAQPYLTLAIDHFRTLGESRREAEAWRNLGIIAGRQGEWAEAERCYRESLLLSERQEDAIEVAITFGCLAEVTAKAGRSDEAQGWFKQALEIHQYMDSSSAIRGKLLYEFAAFLLRGFEMESASMKQLAAARDYAEQALPINEKRDDSALVWNNLKMLFRIANLEGQSETAQVYHHRMHNMLVSSKADRSQMDRLHGRLIATIVAAVSDDMQAKEELQEALQEDGNKGTPIDSALSRILAGERDWYSLTSAVDLDEWTALLTLRVLEILAQFTDVTDKAPEQVVASLPLTIRDALANRNIVVFGQELKALLPEKQQIVMTVIGTPQMSREKEAEEIQNPLGAETLTPEFEQLLHAIVAAANGSTALQDNLEETLSDLEANGWHIRDAVQRIWNGERDVIALIEGLDKQEAALVQWILEAIPQSKTFEIPYAIYEAMEHDDDIAFQKAFEALSLEEQQSTMEAIHLLSTQSRDEVKDETEGVPDFSSVIQQLEPLLQAIAAVAMGDINHRSEVEEELVLLETQNYHIHEVAQRIWVGERDLTALTEGLDEYDTAAVQRILEIIAKE